MSSPPPATAPAPPGRPTFVRAWLRDLGIGVGALTTHFIIDAAESWHHVQQATSRLKASAEGTDQLMAALSTHLAGTLAGYILLGFYAGVVLHIWQGLARPARPALTGSLVLIVSVLLLNLVEMLVLPGVHDWFLYRAELAEMLSWRVPAGALVLLLTGTIPGGFRRNGAPSRPVLRLLAFAAALSLPAVLLRVPEPPASHKNAGPNIIILSFDALRPDHIGHFGYKRPIAPGELDKGSISPNLDAFLSEASVWTSASTPLARTWPAWASLLTGEYPYTTGLRDPLPSPDHIAPLVPTLPATLQSAGWTTAFRTDDSRFSYMEPSWGWDRIEQPTVSVANFAISGSEPRFRAFLGLLDNPLGWALVPVIRENQAFGRSYRNTRFNTGTLRTLSELSSTGRFFYAIHDCTLHAPADRHFPQTTLFGQESYFGTNRYRYMSSGSSAVSDEQPEGAEKLGAAQNVNLYDAGVVLIDQTFGGVIAELRASGLWDTSIVVLMSDHGEDMLSASTRYKYNGPNHGYHPWGEGQYRSLLAVHWPPSLAEGHPAGNQDQLVSLIDLAPTLAAALDLPWKSDGRSLYDTSPRILYTETGLSEASYFPPGHRGYPFKSSASSYSVEPGTGRVYQNPELWPAILRVKDRFVKDDQYKLIWYAMEKGFYLELYDWRADPENIREISAAHPEAVTKLWPALAERLHADGEVVPDDPTIAQPLPQPLPQPLSPRGIGGRNAAADPHLAP